MNFKFRLFYRSKRGKLSTKNHSKNW